MGTTLRLAAVVAGVCAAIAAPTGPASAETPQEVINRLQSQGYIVTIDRIGTGPVDDCVVTGIRHPKKMTQWVPYVGPGRPRTESVLVEGVISQSVSVSLDCSR